MLPMANAERGTTATCEAQEAATIRRVIERMVAIIQQRPLNVDEASTLQDAVRRSNNLLATTAVDQAVAMLGLVIDTLLSIAQQRLLTAHEGAIFQDAAQCNDSGNTTADAELVTIFRGFVAKLAEIVQLRVLTAGDVDMFQPIIDFFRRDIDLDASNREGIRKGLPAPAA